jgi:CysZ protein
VIAPAVVARVPLPDSSFGHALATALRFFVTVLATAVSALLAASFAPVLSAPALERIIVLRERALSLPPRPPVSLFTEIWCGLRAQLLAYTVGIPVLVVLWVVTLAFPPAAVVTFPLKLATTAALLAWTLLDYPLSTRGVPLRARLVFVRRELPRVIGFTAAVFVLFAIPLGAVVLLPAAVAAATEIGVKRLTEPTREQSERTGPSV